MPFVRHELGKRLRLRRIPELHVRLDDTAERGTRVLQLLDELEAGAAPDEIAARRRDRCRRRCRGCPDATATRPTGRRATGADPPTAAPRSGAGGATRRPRARRPAAGRLARGAPAAAQGAARPGTVARAGDDRPSTSRRGAAAVPRGARRAAIAAARSACSSSATRTRMPTRSARRSASPRSCEALGGARDARLRRPAAAAVRLPAPASTACGPIPSRGVEYDLLVVSRLRHARAHRRASASATRTLLRRLPRVIDRPPRLERRDAATPTGSIRTPPRRARWSRCSRARLGVPLTAGRRRARDRR